MLLLSSLPVVSKILWSHGLQQARPPHSSLYPIDWPSSCPLHSWCHPAISPPDAIFSFHPQSIPASGTFPMCQLFVSDDQNTGVWALASVLPTSTQGWFPLRLTDLITLLSKVSLLLRSLLQHHSSKASILWHSAFFRVQLSQLYMASGKTIVLTIGIFVSRIMSLIFNTLSRIVIDLMPRSKCLLISWLWLPSTVILEPKKSKFVTISTTFPPLFAVK